MRDLDVNAVERALSAPALVVGGAEFLPCPFCGGPAEMIHPMGNWQGTKGGTRPAYGPDGSRIVCAKDDCSGCGRAFYGLNQDSEAASQWNTRRGEVKMDILASTQRARSSLYAGDEEVVRIQRADLRALLVAINSYDLTMRVIGEESDRGKAEIASQCAEIAASIANDPARFPAIRVEAYSVASVICREICKAFGVPVPELSEGSNATPLTIDGGAALHFYAEHVANCRKMGGDGNRSRQELNDDGGKRAREALAQTPREGWAEGSAAREAYRLGFMRATYPSGWAEDDGANYEPMMAEDLEGIER